MKIQGEKPIDPQAAAAKPAKAPRAPRQKQHGVAAADQEVLIAGSEAALAGVRKAAPKAGKADTPAEALFAAAASGKVPKAVLAPIASGAWSLGGKGGVLEVFAAAVAEHGWDAKALAAALAPAFIKATDAREPARYQKAFKELELAAKQDAAASRPLLVAIIHAYMDRSTRQGLQPTLQREPYLDRKVPPFVPARFGAAYVAELARAVPPRGEDGMRAAAGVWWLANYNWLPEDQLAAYLESDPAIAAGSRRAGAIRAAEPLVAAKHSLAGFALDGDVLYAPAPDGVLRVGADGAARKVADTGKFAPRAIAATPDELVVLSINRDVGYLDVLDKATGESRRRLTLPRPIHHIGEPACALTKDGWLVYGSSDNKRRDMLVAVDPRFDGKDPKRADKLGRHVVEPPVGFKLKGLAVEGDFVYAAMAHDGKKQFTIMRYRLPELDEPTELLAAPLPIAGYHFLIDTLAVTRDRMILGGSDVVYVFARRAAGLEPLRVVPLTGLEDIRARPDGGADVVLDAGKGPNSRATVLHRLSKQDVAEVFG